MNCLSDYLIDSFFMRTTVSCSMISTVISTYWQALIFRSQKAISLLSAHKLIALDIFERLFITTLFLRFAMQIFHHSLEVDPRLMLLLASETLPFFFIILRKPSNTLSTRMSDWLYALAGSTMSLLVPPGVTNPVVPVVLCYTLIVLGLFTQVSAKVSLGLSFGIVPANRGVKSDGPYRLVRHPIYAGYTLTHIGLWLAAPSLLNAALYITALVLQVARIEREERVLSADLVYREFAQRVRYRLLPGVF